MTDDTNATTAPDAPATPNAPATPTVTVTATTEGSGPAALPNAGTMTREQALAQIETLKSDKSFYARLQQKDQAAHSHWSELHKAAYPSRPAKPEDYGDLAAARHEQEMNEMVAHRRSKWDVTPEQEAELRGTRWEGGRVIRREDWQRARDAVDAMKMDAAWRAKFFAGDRQAQAEWYRAVSALGMRPVG
jgi:hypothetical protein